MCHKNSLEKNEKKSELAKMVKQRHIEGYETHPQVMYVQ